MPNSPTDLEFILGASLGSVPTIYRPTAQSENSPNAWQTLNGELNIALSTQGKYNLRLRVFAQDGAGDPIPDPAWVVKAYTTLNGTGWVPLADRDSHSAHFLTDHYAVDENTRLYRFTVELPNSGIETSFDVTIHRHEPGEDPEDDDVIFVPADDFGLPTDDGDGDTAPERLTAGDLANPF